MRPLKAGIVGCGKIAELHAERLQEIDEELAGVADIDPDARSEFAETYDVSETFESYETMMDELSLDVVVVAVPNFLHADCATPALENDVHVFLEKPLAHTYDDALRIADAAADSHGRVMVGFVRAFSGWFRDLQARADDGEFGSVYDVDVEYVRQRGIPQIGSWFTRKDHSGGGVLIDAGVHVLHLALSLLDFPDIETVSASTGAHFGSKDEYTYLSMWGGDPITDATFDTEDYARGLIRTTDGTAIHLHTAWASNSDFRQEIRVQGDKAGVRAVQEGDTFVPTVYSSDRDALVETELSVPDTDAFTSQWEYFTDVVRGAREHTKNTLEEGLLVQRVVRALYESAEADREVVLSEK